MERIEIDYLACMFELCLEMLSSHYIEIACDRDFYLIFFAAATIQAYAMKIK